MNSRWESALFVAFMFAFGAAGCGEDGSSLLTDAGADAGDGGDGTPDLENPAITMDNVTAYQGVSGAFGVEVTATDDVGVETVELLVDGEVAASSNAAPFTITWDTTALDPGSVVPIAARATDLSGKTAETDPVTVVVINGGAAIEFTDGSSGEVAIPDPYLDTEVDMKHHWYPEDPASRIVSVVVFTVPEGQPEWQLALDIGTGFCPHGGDTLDAIAVDPVVSGPFVFDSAPDGGFPGGGGQMFYHLGPGSPAEHEGESIGYEIYAYSFE
jgi:hypothetical protein